MLVVDASVVAPTVADGGRDGARFRSLLAGQRLAAPALLRIEVASVLRRLNRTRLLSDRQARTALDDLLALPIVLFPVEPLLPRIWELRRNVTTYDAGYVALAEALGCSLMTADARLAVAPGLRCAVDLVEGDQG